MTPEPSGQSAAQSILQLLDASNARANAATCGPWRFDAFAESGVVSAESGSIPRSCQDAVFIASAKTELPRANGAIAELVKAINAAPHLSHCKYKAPCWRSELEEAAETCECTCWKAETLTRTLAILKGIPQ